MAYLSFKDFKKIQECITNGSLIETRDRTSRWFEANITFTMKDEEYVKVLKDLGFVVTDEDGKEISTDVRPSWDEYFRGFAEAASVRAECSRRQVGAVVVKGKRVIGTGYNGAPAGARKTCLNGGCPRSASGVEPGSSYDTGVGACIAVHAEANALLDAGRRNCSGAKLYVTDKPCDGCLKLIKAAGIKRVVWPDGEMKVKPDG